MDNRLMHVTPYSKADPAIVASHAEKLGFESYWVGDHTIVPVESSIPYPGTKHDGREPYYVSQLPDPLIALARAGRSEEHTSELQSQSNLVCRLLLEKKTELL